MSSRQERDFGSPPSRSGLSVSESSLEAAFLHVTHVTRAGVIAEESPAVCVADHATQFFLEHLTIHPGERVAEAGCGSGILSIFAALAGASSVIGTDIDTDFLAIARANAQRNRAGQVAFQQCHLLDAVPGPLDAIIALLPHKPAPSACICITTPSLIRGE